MTFLSFCGCCGRFIGLTSSRFGWCITCKNHVSSETDFPNTVTYMAQYNKPCPWQLTEDELKLRNKAAEVLSKMSVGQVA